MIGRTAGAPPAGAPRPGVTAPHAPRAPSGRRVLGRLLVEMDAASEAQLARALSEQRRTRERIGEILSRHGVAPDRIARALALQLHLDHAPSPLRPDTEALKLIERDVAERLRILPLSLHERALRVAMADPLDLDAIDDLRFRTGRRIEPVVASTSAIAEALRTAYGSGEVSALLDRIAEGRVVGSDGVEEVSDIEPASESAPVVALVDLLLTRAVAARASDLHIEPGDGALRVRARVDGSLRDLLDLPARLGAAVVSRIKIMAGLDIATKRLPQDGRCAVQASGEDLSLRVSTLPAVGGEKVVLRLLRQDTEGRSLDEVGLSTHDRTRLDSLLGHAHGAILVTGPTGSGKTTTLYAALAALDRERRNVVTLEDPVEYRLPGVTQVPVEGRGRVDFAGALRAVLRQDPDVIMVGEMRDRATAEVALAAALTGHLVLSTLHTNDAASAVTRLLELGAPPYLIAGALVGVVAQRLVRRRCSRCAPNSAPTAADDDAPHAQSAALPARARDAACEHCGGSGFRGRIGIYEVLVVDDAIRGHILKRRGAASIRASARRAGMRLLREDALAKLQAGSTTIDEIRPHIGEGNGRVRTCPDCGRERRRGYRACPRCGRVLVRTCTCGTVLRTDWAHCARCGEPARRGP